MLGVYHTSVTKEPGIMKDLLSSRTTPMTTPIIIALFG